MTYFIAAEIAATAPIADITSALQRAYDNGASGDFQVLATTAPSFVVVFKRDAQDDAEYVIERVNPPETSINKAAQQQLAAELQEGDLGECAHAVIGVLSSGEAQCFDFGMGVFEAIAKWSPEPVAAAL